MEGINRKTKMSFWKRKKIKVTKFIDLIMANRIMVIKDYFILESFCSITQSFSKTGISSLELRSNTEQVRKKDSLLQASRKGCKEPGKENNLKTVSQSSVQGKV